MPDLTMQVRALRLRSFEVGYVPPGSRSQLQWKKFPRTALSEARVTPAVHAETTTPDVPFVVGVTYEADLDAKGGLRVWVPRFDAKYLPALVKELGVRPALLAGIDPKAMANDPVGTLKAAGVDSVGDLGRAFPPGWAPFLVAFRAAGASYAEAVQTFRLHVEDSRLGKGDPARWAERLSHMALSLAEHPELTVSYDVLVRLQHSKPPTSEARAIAAGLRALCRGERNGHSITGFGRVAGSISRTLEVPFDWASATLQVALKRGDSPIRNAGRRSHVARKITQIREMSTAKYAFSAAKRGANKRMDLDAGDSCFADFNPIQLSAVSAVAARRLTILVGAAGTGKTHVARAIGEHAEAKDYSVAWTATTGHASKVLHSQNGETLHRFLGVVPRMLVPARNEHVDLLIVDEASMLDLEMADPLFRALEANRVGRLLLVGDPYQLPSVGAGNVLGDLIGSPALARNVVRLEQQHRSEVPGIISLASAIRSGAQAWPCPAAAGVDYLAPGSLDAYREAIVAHASTATDCLVITARYDGPLGVSALSKLMRDLRLGQSDDPWLVGERVISTRNIPIGEPDENGRRDFIANGTFGTVTATEDRSVSIHFETGKKWTFVGPEWVPTRGALDGGYAMSIHRAQGTEADTVIVVIEPGQTFTSPAHGYTAVTRATRELVVLGDPVALFDGGPKVRNTDLVERIAWLARPAAGPKTGRAA